MKLFNSSDTGPAGFGWGGGWKKHSLNGKQIQMGYEKKTRKKAGPFTR